MAILKPSNGLRLPQMKPDCVHQKGRSACVCYTISCSERSTMLYARPAKMQYESMASVQYNPMASTHDASTRPRSVETPYSKRMKYIRLSPGRGPVYPVQSSLYNHPDLLKVTNYHFQCKQRETHRLRRRSRPCGARSLCLPGDTTASRRFLPGPSSHAARPDGPCGYRSGAQAQRAPCPYAPPRLSFAAIIRRLSAKADFTCHAKPAIQSAFRTG